MAGVDPARLAESFRVPLTAVFRRLAVLPADVLEDPVGLIICDASGTLIFRKAVPGFPLPRFSAACPKWPLFQALSRPLVPIRQKVEQPGQDPLVFDCFAISEPVGRVAFDSALLSHAYMLVHPVANGEDGSFPVGSTCRICPRESCEGRREPSILVAGI
jgi:predicted transcriptional regulator